MNPTKPYPKIYTLFNPAMAETIARKLKAADPDWNYVAVHDPKGTGQSFVEIYDEDGEFVSRFVN